MRRTYTMQVKLAEGTERDRYMRVSVDIDVLDGNDWWPLDCLSLDPSDVARAKKELCNRIKEDSFR